MSAAYGTTSSRQWPPGFHRGTAVSLQPHGLFSTALSDGPGQSVFIPTRSSSVLSPSPALPLPLFIANGMLTSVFLSALAASLVTAAPSYGDVLPTQPVSTPSSGTNGTNSTSFISSAWYPGWESAKFPVSSVSWQKYSLVTYAFAYVHSPLFV